MCRCHKQVGKKDCGLFSLAFAVALVFNLNPIISPGENEKPFSGLFHQGSNDALPLQVT